MTKRNNEIKIALCSMNQVWEDKDKNREKVFKLTKIAKENNADLIIFPEMTLTGYSLSSNKIAEDINSSESIKFFSKLSDNFKIAIVFGMASVQNSQYFNSAFFVNGNYFTFYNKIHTFTFVGENNYYLNGNKLTIFHYLNCSFGLTICYDLRFPEIYSLLSKDTEVIINIANWPSRRLEHWYNLLASRAIENQIFMIGVNRVGEDPNSNIYEKSSIIFDPNGKALKPNLQIEEELDIYYIQLDTVRSLRDSFPTFKDKRYYLYKNLYDKEFKSE